MDQVIPGDCRGQGESGGSNNAHRLIRRGLPYGPNYDPSQPYDGIERGLLGYFINSSIENQHEFVLGHLGKRRRIRRGGQVQP
jgi:deferrochelatase/peroxidase EfeB